MVFIVIDGVFREDRFKIRFFYLENVIIVLLFLRKIDLWVVNKGMGFVLSEESFCFFWSLLNFSCVVVLGL